MAENKIFPKQFEGSGPAGHTNKANTAIEIFHLLTGTTVKFIPFITEFSDNHTSEWSAESVYGRMDDLLSYQRTKRSISLAFDCPSQSDVEALNNLKNLSLLKQFMYPSYSDVGNALSMRGAPLFRVKLLNFINSLSTDGKGLLCTISQISFSPNNDAGFYIMNQNTVDPREQNNVIVPKLFSLRFEMNVLHEFTPGWNVKEEFNNTLYPYNLQSQLAKLTKESKSGLEKPADKDKPINIAQIGAVLEPKK
jgi:hypothetical protein